MPELQRLAMRKAARRVARLLSWDHDVVHMIGLELWARKHLRSPRVSSEADYVFASPKSLACARERVEARAVADARSAAWDAIVVRVSRVQELFARASIASAATRPLVDELSTAHLREGAMEAVSESLRAQLAQERVRPHTRASPSRASRTHARAPMSCTVMHAVAQAVRNFLLVVVVIGLVWVFARELYGVARHRGLMI